MSNNSLDKKKYNNLPDGVVDVAHVLVQNISLYNYMYLQQTNVEASINLYKFV